MSDPTLQDYLDAANAPNATNAQSIFAAPSGLTLLDPADLNSLENPSRGFYAQTYLDASGNVIISFESSLINPWDHPAFDTQYGVASRNADAAIAIGQTPDTVQGVPGVTEEPVFTDALAYTQQVEHDYGGTHRVFVTGFSLGGVEAEEVGYEAAIGAIGPIAGGVTFGATGLPGFNGSTSSVDFVDYIDSGDPVGNYASDAKSELSAYSETGCHFGGVVSAPDSAIGYEEHAALLQLALASAALTGGPISLATLLPLLGSLKLYHSLSVYADDLNQQSPSQVPAIPTLSTDPNLSGSFDISPYELSAKENSGSIKFTITPLTPNFSGTVYVSTVHDLGVDNPNNDYYYQGILNRAVTFVNGAPVNVNVLINDLGLTIGSESFRLIVQSSPNDPVSDSLASTTFTIRNTDPPLSTYNISTDTPSVDENGGAIRFSVSRSNVSDTETVFVSTVHDEGFANPGGDYYYQGLLNQPITFAVGQSSIPVTVLINDLGLTSGSETFRLIVQSDPSNPVSQTLASRNFTIENTDVATGYTISGPSSVPENGGAINFQITRSGSTANPADVYVSTVPNKDTNSNNYYYDEITGYWVHFAPGQSTVSAPPIIVNDRDLQSGSETFGFIVQQNATDPPGQYLASTTFTINNTDTSQVSLSGTQTGTTVWSGTTTISAPVYLDRQILGGGSILNSLLENAGTMIVQAGGTIISDGNAGDTVINETGGTFIVDAATYFQFIPTFQNEGLFIVNPGSGNVAEITSYLNYQGIAFENSGTVEVQSGTFNIYQGGSSNASSFSVAAGATLLITGGTSEPFTFSGGTYNVAGTTQIGNSQYTGNLVFAAGTTVNLGSSWVIYGTLDLSAATLVGSFDGLAFSGGGTGKVVLGANSATVVNLNMSGDILDGSGLITLAGSGVASGTVQGGGTVDNTGTLDVGSLELQGGGVFQNQGAVNISNGSFWSDSSNSSIENFAGSSITIEGSGGIGVGTLENAGMFEVGQTSQSTLIYSYIKNAGIMDFESGAIYLEDGGTSDASGYQAAIGVTLNFSSGTFVFTGGTYRVDGITTNAAKWVLTGSTTIGSSVQNYGTIEIQEGTLTIQQAESGNGMVALDAGTTLALADPTDFSNSIAGFGAALGTTIDLMGIKAASATLNGDDQLVVSDGSNVVATLQLSGTALPNAFYVTSDGNGGSDIVAAVGPAPQPWGLSLSSASTQISGVYYTNLSRPTVTGSGEPGYTVRLYNVATQIGSAIVNAAGTWSTKLVALAPGEYGLTAREYGATAKLSQASEVLNLVVDTTPPTVSLGQSVSVAGGTTVTFSGSIGDNAAVASVHVFSGKTDFGAAQLNADGTWGLTATVPAGWYGQFKAVATDAAGNSASAAAGFTLNLGVTGKPFEAVETDRNSSGQITDQIFFDVIGAIYSQYENLFDSAGHLTEQLFTGVSGKPFTSFQRDYDQTGHLAEQIFYQGSTIYEDEIFNTDGSRAIIYENIVGKAYSSLEYDYNSAGKFAETIVKYNNGTEAIVGHVSGLTLSGGASNDRITGGGTNEIFLFSGLFGHDTVADLYSHISGTGHDFVSLPSAPFNGNFSQLLAATNFGVNGASIKVDTNDTVFLVGVTHDMMVANSGDFLFHS